MIDNNISFDELSNDDKESVILLNNQISGVLIGIYAYIILYMSTMEGIDVIYSKYNGHEKDNLQADELAVISTYLFLIERSILAKVAFTRYDIIYNKFIRGEFEYSLKPNMEINLANVLGIISEILFVLGAEGIYARDNNQPVFGI